MTPAAAGAAAIAGASQGLHNGSAAGASGDSASVKPGGKGKRRGIPLSGSGAGGQSGRGECFWNGHGDSKATSEGHSFYISKACPASGS